MKVSMLSRSFLISAIKSSTNQRFLAKGRSVHAQIVKSGFLPEIQLFNHLLNMYSKSMDFLDACKLFDEMPERNLVSFSTLISRYSQSSTPQSAFDIVPELQKQDLSPNQFVFSSLILACSKLKFIDYGKQIHAQVVISDFESDPFVKASLIDMYSKFDDLGSAFTVFSQHPVGDVVTYNSMISGFVCCGFCMEALTLFMDAWHDFELKPTDFTFSSVIKACADLQRAIGEQMHCFSMKVGLNIDRFVGTALVDMYSRYGDMGSSEIVFGSIFCADLALYNAMIVGFAHNDLNESSLEFFKKLKLEGFRPNECTFSSVLKACTGLKCLNLGRILHGVIQKSEFNRDLVVNAALIDMYMKCGCVDVSCKVFDHTLERNTVLYNSMMLGHGQNGNFEEAVRLFIDMNHQGYEPDLATFVVVMSSCLRYGWSCYVHAIKRGFGLDLIVQNALLDGLIKGSAVDEALWFFNKMHERNVVSWTTIISGLCQLDLDLDALEVFKKMWAEGVHPNCFTFSCVLKACASLVGLEQGRCIHACCIKHGIIDEEFTNSALLDMYAKCGALEESHRLFNEFTNGNIVSWNSMIAGCARHGYGVEALKLLKRMEELGVKPNHVTFISLLSSCSHCGLVDDGVHIFEMMTHKHGIIPCTEHYACMVDMFGRAGMLDRAKDLIDGMPFEPDMLVWRIFLAACKLHGYVELAQHARDHVFRMEGEDNATFVLMSNIYSEAGKWDDVEKLRKRMKDGGVKKQPGLSWVQIKDTPWPSSMLDPLNLNSA